MKSGVLNVLVLTLGSFLLSGCLAWTPPATSAESRGLTVAARSSPKVHVFGPRLQMNRGHLELAGQVGKQPLAFSTAFSHLDVQFLNRSGQVLAEKPIHFVPHSVGVSRSGARVAYYSLNLDSVPEGTVQIEVLAHDAEINAAHPAPPRGTGG